MILGDGAIWIWNLAAEQFPGAILIVDFYHACEHLHQIGRLLFPGDTIARKVWTDSAVDLLDKGEIESLVTVLRSLASERPGRSGQSDGDGLALNFEGEAEIGAMAGVVRLMAVAVGLAATARGGSNGTATQVAELGDLTGDLDVELIKGIHGIGDSQKR